MFWVVTVRGFVSFVRTLGTGVLSSSAAGRNEVLLLRVREEICWLCREVVK